jgi:oxygen-independent coproporphyrinogen-3 oxidase
LRQAGFDNLNLDLIFAIPGQTLDVWRRTIREVLTLGSEHLSCYEVIYEEDTPLYAQLKAGQFDVDEGLACDMYDALVDLVTANGFRQYEIANFARHRAGEDGEIPKLACQHNVNYWHGGSFYGLGPSATGYVRGERTKNWANTSLYCEQLEKGQRAFESGEQLAPLARAGETAAFGLRMTAGWRFDHFHQVTGYDLREHWGDEMRQLADQGMGCLEEDRFRLTPKGLRFADAAAERFIRLSG